LEPYKFYGFPMGLTQGRSQVLNIGGAKLRKKNWGGQN